jgi:hypothetical protein
MAASLARLQLLIALLASGVTLYEAGYWSLALYDLLTVAGVIYYFNGRSKFICNTCFHEVRSRHAPAECSQCGEKDMERKIFYKFRSKLSEKKEQLEAKA